MRKVKKSVIVSAIIKIKCVLHVLNSDSEFELSLAWRLLMSQKKKYLIYLYKEDLNQLFKFFGSDIQKIPLSVYKETFIAPVSWWNKNRLEVYVI